MGTRVERDFMKECRMVVSVTARDPNVTLLGHRFLICCPSFTSLDLSWLVAVTTNGIASSSPAHP